MASQASVSFPLPQALSLRWVRDSSRSVQQPGLPSAAWMDRVRTPAFPQVSRNIGYHPASCCSEPSHSALGPDATELLTPQEMAPVLWLFCVPCLTAAGPLSHRVSAWTQWRFAALPQDLPIASPSQPVCSEARAPGHHFASFAPWPSPPVNMKTLILVTVGMGLMFAVSQVRVQPCLDLAVFLEGGTLLGTEHSGFLSPTEEAG